MNICAVALSVREVGNHFNNLLALKNLGTVKDTCALRAFSSCIAVNFPISGPSIIISERTNQWRQLILGFVWIRSIRCIKSSIVAKGNTRDSKQMWIFSAAASASLWGCCTWQVGVLRQKRLCRLSSTASARTGAHEFGQKWCTPKTIVVSPLKQVVSLLKLVSFPNYWWLVSINYGGFPIKLLMESGFPIKTGWLVSR